MERPETRYARSGDIHIAYQVVGDGPVDLVYVPPIWSHVELQWENENIASALQRLASFSRLIMYDKRGTGLSDRSTATIAYEQHLDDLVAVMDAAGSKSAALYGYVDGGIIALLFAAAYPERTRAVVTVATPPRILRAPDWPHGIDRQLWEQVLEQFDHGGYDILIGLSLPVSASDPELVEWSKRQARASISPGDAVAFMRATADTDIREILPIIQAPTLVTHLADDALFSSDNARYLADRLPNAKLLLHPGADYLDFWHVDALDEVEAFVTGARPAARVDRVLATVLFMDVVDSTVRAAELGDRRWREVLDRFESIVRRELDRFRGTLVSTAGDGFLATFDGPARAVHCAQTLHDSLLAIELETRAGLHTGEVELRGEDVAGLGVHIASRVMDAAGSGDVLVSRTVTDLVAGSGLEFDERGEHELKGVPGRWQLYAVRS